MKEDKEQQEKEFSKERQQQQKQQQQQNERQQQKEQQQQQRQQKQKQRQQQLKERQQQQKENKEAEEKLLKTWNKQAEVDPFEEGNIVKDHKHWSKQNNENGEAPIKQDDQEKYGNHIKRSLLVFRVWLSFF